MGGVVKGKGAVMLGERARGGSNLFVQIEHVEEELKERVNLKFTARVNKYSPKLMADLRSIVLYTDYELELGRYVQTD